jgi:urea carboxylase/allophanate hydrolase
LVRVEESVLDLIKYESWLDKNKLDIESRKAHQARAISSSPFIEELVRPCLQANSNSGKDDLEIKADTVPGEWIQAMMPGRCYKINVKEGDMVHKGDVLVSNQPFLKPQKAMSNKSSSALH